ncbi:MAG TPA: AraC family transcriptional regulator [Abditibacterium sp.]|jgi:AraC-like DNA-binding protein
MESPAFVPFIRWADTVRVVAGGYGARDRQIYDHELVYVLEGAGSLVLDGQKHAVGADCLFLVRPRVFHSFMADVGQSQRLLGVHFDWKCEPDAARFDTFREASAPRDESLFRAPREVCGWDVGKKPFLDLRGRPRVRQRLEEVVAEYGRRDSESRSVAGALLGAALGQIEREVRLLREVGKNHRLGADAVRRVQKARDLLEAAGDEHLSIEEVAARVGWSGDHLRRMCRAVLGDSPAQLQAAARLRRAKELLRYGGLPISEIAGRCGFDDASHFARVFKRAIGQTPREWAVLSRSAIEERQ